MKTASVKELKDELKHQSKEDLMQICLSLSKFKKENKELLSYLLFEASNENHYILSVKEMMDIEFEEINRKNYYWMKKSIRKILRNTKKYIRYSKKKETEIELLLHFCIKLLEIQPSIKSNNVLLNILERTVVSIKKSIESLHEDLQYDYHRELDNLLIS